MTTQCKMFNSLLLLLLFCLSPLVSWAQDNPAVPRFGYLSYSTVYRQMPEYAQAQSDFAALKEKYEAEARRSEEEFQRKFAEFLQGQKDFPASILKKRQAELQELMDKSVSFRDESRRLLLEAEGLMQAPVEARLNQALQAVGAAQGLLFIINTDGNACPFVHPEAGIDVTPLVLSQLGIEPSAEATAQP